MSEVAQPKSEEEKRFKAQHDQATGKHPVATDAQHKGHDKPKARRKADQEGDANYDKAYIVKEAKEDDEPASPDESSMAQKQAEFIQYVGREMGEHVKAGKEFPEWMQNKLSAVHQAAKDLHSTLGAHGGDDDMDESYGKKMKKEELKGGQKALDHNKNGKLDAHDFKMMRAKKKNEEVDLEEGHATWEVSFKTQGHKTQTVKGRNTAEAIKKAEKRATAAHPKKQMAMYKGIKKVSEEVEQIDELSKKTLGSYIKKAADDKADNAYNLGARDADNKGSWGKSFKRRKGIAKAVDKLANEEVEQIDELSQETLRQYHGKAGADLQKKREKLDKGTLTSKDYKQGRNRAAGLNRAANKMEEVEVNESVEMLDETFKQGIIKFKDKSQMILKKEDADVLNSMFKGMSSTNRKKMTSDAMESKKAFEEILGFAREA